VSSNQWELEEADAALCEDPPCVPLARRYISKALEYVRCMYCHKSARLGEDGVSSYFKGIIHDDCKEKYGGRGDYMRQHGEDP
jgi:hypothetical protein